MTDLLNFEWLVGMWEGIQGQGIYHEEWVMKSETELSGKAYLINKGEIKNSEILKIHISGGNIFYTADVSHNPDPVSFKLTSQNNNIFIFENPEHDFPQKITYERKDNDSLLAVVEAVKDGKTRKIEYNLRLIR